MSFIEKIRNHFIDGGYTEYSKYKIPNSLLLQPDLVFSKNDYTYLILIKSNNSIPPAYLLRISKIPFS